MSKIKELLSKLKEYFKNSILPKLKELLAKRRTKQVLGICGIVLLIAALVGGTIKIVNYSKTAYLKPYIEKYDDEYPDEILEEMCDAYGENQSIRGRLSIKDLNWESNVSCIVENNSAFLENGADIKKDQHFRAIRLNDGSADIESLYSTTELFLNSSQSVEFTTLYEKQQYRVIAAYYINTKPEDDNGYVFPYNFCGNMSKKDFESFEDRIVHRELYYTGYEFSPEDYFLSISAPSDFMEDFRFVIVCVKADKKGFEKSQTAAPNEKIFFPQIWYDVNDEQNPYIFAGKWYPKAI